MHPIIYNINNARLPSILQSNTKALNTKVLNTKASNPLLRAPTHGLHPPPPAGSKDEPLAGVPRLIPPKKIPAAPTTTKRPIAIQTGGRSSSSNLREKGEKRETRKGRRPKTHSSTSYSPRALPFSHYTSHSLSYYKM